MTIGDDDLSYSVQLILSRTMLQMFFPSFIRGYGFINEGKEKEHTEFCLN
jgi:hypothetical protein